MNINEIKQTVQVTTLNLQRQLTNDEKKAATEWMSHWDDSRRLRVSMTDSTLAALKSNMLRTDLTISVKDKEANEKRAAYRIVTVFVLADLVDSI